MKLSWNWLSELVDLSGISVDEAARLLPLRTADVESVERLGGGLEKVVTAKVILVEPHPGADRLRLCTVDYGAATTMKVVCGAPNVALGQIVCFAPVGTTLPNGLTLKKAKIRGVDSEGMICAEDEMGLGTAHDGIVVLPEGTKVGLPVGEVLGVTDTILDINNSGITSRPDLWGHVGFARELGAIFGREMPLRGTSILQGVEGESFPVTIEDPAGCRRYVGFAIEGVVNGPSPAKIRRRLEALGLRSIDLLVDLSNYVMLETGQPLHAFDVRSIEGGRIVVRRARAGERMKTLDGKDLVLVEDDLVIADAVKPLALAGVMGGEASGVRADTTSILLESANFDPARIRRSAIRHGLRTDASTRFEKTLDPFAARAASRRYVELLAGLVPTARVVRREADVYPRPFPAVSIELPFALVHRRLGLEVQPDVVRSRLAAVGFASAPIAGGLRVEVPSWRATKDVSIPEDLVEEVGRLHGYEHVVPSAPAAPMHPRVASPARVLERDGRSVLSLDLGYAEIASYAFHGAVEAEKLGIGGEALLRLQNPLSAEQDRLQVTSTQNLLRAAIRNRPREASLRLCEWTRILPKSDRTRKDLPSETSVVGMLASEAAVTADPKGAVFLGLVGDVQALLVRLGVASVTVSDVVDGESVHPLLPTPPWLHPGRRAALKAGGEVLALVGELAPSVARAFGLLGRTAVAEVNLARVLATGRPGSPYRPPARFPEAPFDIAIVVPRKTPAATVADVLRRSTPDVVRDVHLFDVYEGKGIPDGHRSLAFTVTFGDDDKTLESKTIEKLQGRAIDAVRRAGYAVRTAEPGPAAHS